MAQDSILWKTNAVRVCNKFYPIINKLRREIAMPHNGGNRSVVAVRYELEDVIYNFMRQLKAISCKISADYIDVIHYKHIKVYDIVGDKMNGRIKVELDGTIVDTDTRVYYLKNKNYDKVVPFIRRNKTVQVKLRQVIEYEIGRIKVI